MPGSESQLCDIVAHGPAASMSSVAGLTPLAPLDGSRRPIERSPFWIGSDRTTQFPVFRPGVARQHASILTREDGHWLSPSGGEVRLNGMPITASSRLSDGDVIELCEACELRFDDGVPRTPTASEPPPSTEPARRPTRRRRLRISRRQVAIGATIVVVVALLGTAAVLSYVALRQGPETRLSPADAATLDSLLGAAYDHIERGNTLLELGAAPAALNEFAAGVNVLKLSRLRENPAVMPRIEAMEASVAEIYRERRLAVPSAYQTADRAPDGGQALKAVLSVTEFTRRFGEVGRLFRTRYAKDLVVTGSDHAEHVSLYGRGGAVDLRTRDLSREQVQFVIGEFRQRGIRVKDFSTDSVLQRQIRSALNAGLIDRVGTGLHLHIDRFANRRDSFTLSLREQTGATAMVGNRASR